MTSEWPNDLVVVVVLVGDGFIIQDEAIPSYCQPYLLVVASFLWVSWPEPPNYLCDGHCIFYFFIVSL